MNVIDVSQLLQLGDKLDLKEGAMSRVRWAAIVSSTTVGWARPMYSVCNSVHPGIRVQRDSWRRQLCGEQFIILFFPVFFLPVVTLFLPIYPQTI